MRNAKQAEKSVNELSFQGESQVHQVCEIEPYEGKNQYVIEMQFQLLQLLREDLLDALVHGSLGTYEETAYSDFDALVILRDEVFSHRSRLVRAARILHELRRIMYKMDPLQHHGWFVLTESSLRNFPVLYFPPALLAYSKSMLHSSGSKLYISYSGQHDFSAPLHRLCQSLERKLSSALPKNLYAVKNLLSEFMLLPALYVQARDRKGMYKKFSFEAARPDFTTASWQAMERTSSIRSDWKSLLKEDGLSPESVHMDTVVPGSLKSRLDGKCLETMLHLVKEAKEKVK